MRDRRPTLQGRSNSSYELALWQNTMTENPQEDLEKSELAQDVVEALPVVAPALRRPPGPGLPEAIFWTLAVVAVHLAGSTLMAILMLVGRFVFREVGEGPLSIEQFATDSAVPILTGEMLVFVAFGAVAVMARFGADAKRRLGVVSMRMGQLLLILCLWLPLSFACGRLHSWTLIVWTQIAPYIPFSRALDRFQTVTMIRSLAETTSFPILALLLAAAPAVGEELVFRGLIGNGLVARWGKVAGVLLTSVLFAAVHIHPAQVVALIPLAVCIHIVYLATRCLWAPILLHFLNNLLAVFIMKTAPVDEAGELVQQAAWPGAITILAILACFALIRILWQTRIQYRLPDGTVWSPGYATIARPADGLESVLESARPGWYLIGLAAGTLTAFAALMLNSLIADGLFR